MYKTSHITYNFSPFSCIFQMACFSPSVSKHQGLVFFEEYVLYATPEIIIHVKFMHAM